MGCRVAVRPPSQNHTTEMSSVKGLAGKGERPLTKMTSKPCSCPIHEFCLYEFYSQSTQPLQDGVCAPSLVCSSVLAVASNALCLLGAGSHLGLFFAFQLNQYIYCGVLAQGLPAET